VKQHLRGELDFYRENRIRIRHAGDREGLPPDIVREIEAACEDTGDFTGMQVILALNYGGRDEIIRAVNRAWKQKSAADPSGESRRLGEGEIRQYLDNPDVPDPDLIIRTAGEFRTSNFLLWEGAYAEYYISGKFWPDWTEEDLALAIEDFRGRDRRFGGVVK
jgi:undecaprenyl diphosphate synthase